MSFKRNLWGNRLDISLQVPRELNGLPWPGREALRQFRGRRSEFHRHLERLDLSVPLLLNRNCHVFPPGRHRAIQLILPQEIIAKKRGGKILPGEDIEAFIAGYTRGEISDAQAAALAIAIFFKGLDARECAALTLAMARSGTILSWREADLPGPVVDKHSTGGVGDTVSLILAPAVAACGLFVPMIAGRGLGHTGGTIDKLESIPGYNTAPDKDRLMEVVRRCGCAIVGQTEDLAPADKKLYAVRDVTATVESIPLITASILAKKLAAGLDALVVDVKTGSGAFLPSFDAARALAESISSVGAEAGLPVHALITDMDEPLAPSHGSQSTQ